MKQINNSEKIEVPKFQYFCIGFMFIFLWLFASFFNIFLIPTHAKIMEIYGASMSSFTKSAVLLYKPILIGSILCLLLMGLGKSRVIRDSTRGKTQRVIDHSPPTWRRILMFVLILLVIYLNIGLSIGWLEGMIYYPKFLGKKPIVQQQQ